MAVIVCTFSPRVLAQDTQDAAACSPRVTRASLVRCALAASLIVKSEHQELSAAQARKLATAPLLPSNPTLALSGARRTSAAAEGYNWSATLSQELEIAGQRGTRLAAAEASIDAESRKLLLLRRETAALAWQAFFELIAATQEQRLAAALAVAAEAVLRGARARAEQGLVAGVDVDVADATTVHALQTQLAADRRALQASATLASLLGFDPPAGALSIEGELVPLEEVTGALASSALEGIAKRPEILALAAERKALELRADALRRTRIPNPTVSLFAQRDGFNERVLGAGISFPIPLPGNVGRTYLGEIAEAEALAHRAQYDQQRTEREIRLEIATASDTFASRAREVEAFSPERVRRAETTLVSLGQEVAAGRLAIRDAVVAQQALIELLQANIEARRQWCLASIDLARAIGVPLEGRAP